MLAAGIFALATCYLSGTGQPILFNDEIGYWSNCNFLLGKDWISVTSRIGYYSYGYSLLLIPVRLLGIWLSWGWKTYYHAGVVLNAILLVLSYFLSQKIVKRLMPDLNDYVRILACAVIFVYPSTIVYAHITWSECTLLFFTWVFLYLMMRVIDAPSVLNHIAYALTAFYLYVVHQRSLGILAVSVFIVLYLRLLKRNRLPHVFAYGASVYVFYLFHTMMKRYIQAVNYMAGERGGIRQAFGYIADKKSLILLAGMLLLFAFLVLLEKGRTGWITAFILLCVIGAMLWIKHNGGIGIRLEGGDQNRMSTNDFAGQISKVRNIFSKNGLIRLGVSVTGKWFYMASGSALVVCFSLWALFKNVLRMLWEHVKRPFRRLREKRGVADDSDISFAGEAWGTRIWFLGMFLVWLSTFMISAIYKEGLYKNDDLLNGRYVDFIFGFLMVYGLYCLMKDRYWIISTAVFIGMYKAAGWLCQDILDKLKRTQFELAHCVLFGRVIWNYAVPNEKIDIIVGFVLQVSVAFILLVKLGTGRTWKRWLKTILEKVTARKPKDVPQVVEDEPPVREKVTFMGKIRRFLARACSFVVSKIGVVRVVAALLIPFFIWNYIGQAVVTNYVLVRNEKQREPFEEIAFWIRIIGEEDTPIYFLLDYANDRIVGALQFMRPDQPITVDWSGNADFTQDAFYIIKDTCLNNPEVVENCETVYLSRGYALLINRHQELEKTWDQYREWGG